MRYQRFISFTLMTLSFTIGGATKAPLLDVLNDLRLYMEDYGNGKLVTHVPDRPLQRFLENIASGVLPLSYQYYAGTEGAPSVSINDQSARYPILLDPNEGSNKKEDLPDTDQIFEKLFLRGQFIPETRVGANMLLVSFANWFLDEFLRTQPGTDGALYRFPTGINDTTCVSMDHTLRLGQLYGTDPTREEALRTFSGGMMKTGQDGGLPSLPQIRSSHPDFEMVCSWKRDDQSCFNDDTFYATGHERFNFHPGHLVFTELFLREHNHVASILEELNPTWSDQKLFDTTRIILIHLCTKFILNEYVSNAVSTAQDHVMLGYDPDRFRESKYDNLRYQPTLELNHLYRWHALVAENIEFDSELVGFDKLLWTPGEFKARGPVDIIRALHRSRMGAMQAHNTPHYLREVTKGTILDERAQSMQGYNDYREYFTLPRLESFEDLNAGPEATEALRELYKSVDDIDLFVGAMVEQRFPEGTAFTSELVLVSIASFAFGAVLNFDTIKDPRLYSEDLLTEYGKLHIGTASMKGMLARHFGIDDFPCGTPLLLGGKSGCNLIEKPTEWSFQNSVDFVGLDLVLDPFFSETYFHQIFTVFLYVVLAVFGGFFVIHQLAETSMKFYQTLDNSDKFRFVFGSVNVITLTVTAIPYAYLTAKLLYGPDFVETAERDYLPLFAFFFLHGTLYIIESCARLVYSPSGWLLLFHHIMWFAMIIVASATKSVFFLKLDFILDLMVTFEAPLFVALMLRRFSSNLVRRRRAVVAGSLIFLVTRFLQFGVLLQYFVESASRMEGSREWGIFIVGVIGASTLVLLQMYTLTIYYGFYVGDSRLILREKNRMDDVMVDAHPEDTEEKSDNASDNIVLDQESQQKQVFRKSSLMDTGTETPHMPSPRLLRNLSRVSGASQQ